MRALIDTRHAAHPGDLRKAAVSARSPPVTTGRCGCMRTTIISGLSLPTAMTFGPDGALYVSNAGFGFPAGMGQVLRFDLDGWRHTP